MLTNGARQGICRQSELEFSEHFTAQIGPAQPSKTLCHYLGVSFLKKESVSQLPPTLDMVGASMTRSGKRSEWILPATLTLWLKSSWKPKEKSLLFWGGSVSRGTFSTAWNYAHCQCRMLELTLKSSRGITISCSRRSEHILPGRNLHRVTTRLLVVATRSFADTRDPSKSNHHPVSEPATSRQHPVNPLSAGACRHGGCGSKGQPSCRHAPASPPRQSESARGVVRHAVRERRDE